VKPGISPWSIVHAGGNRALRIGVDGRELIGRATGVGRYIREVLRAWTTDPSFPHTLVVFVHAEPSAELRTALGSAVTWDVTTAGVAGTWWEQRHLPRAIRRAQIDVLFAGGYTAPLWLSCPYVLAVYDVSYFAHPEWFRPREGFRRRLVTRRAAQRASTVLTISEFSAGEIVKWIGLPRTKIDLAPPGAPARIAPTTGTEAATASTAAGSTAAAPRSTPGLARPRRVLFVGSLFTRRMIPELIAGFAKTCASVDDAELVLVGDNRTSPRVDPNAVAASHGIAGRVRWLEYVSDAEREQLYASSRAFAFLSAYEGFAMTPLEALAHGVPPVLLDTPVAREVYGDAALLVQPDPASISSALTALLTDDRLRQRLVSEADKLFTRYSWDDSAATIRRALERATR
jgi:glycosyltransferase involved in cell wall biosynthesis